MTIDETAQLLAEIQLIDNRRIEKLTIRAWHELVEDLPYPAATEAVRLHFRESTAYLTPAHVRANVDRIRHAVPDPTDELGNRMDRDEGALAAQARLEGRKELGA